MAINNQKEELSQWLSRHATQRLKTLLEEKHLYQTVRIGVEEIKRRAGEISFIFIDERGAMRGEIPQTVQPGIDDALLHREWMVGFPCPSGLSNYGRPPAPQVFLHLTSMKTSCARCSSIQPFNLHRSFNLYQAEGAISQQEDLGGDQDFAFVYECQSCKSPPDTFLVRRKGEKLTLSGRSPLQVPQVPSSVPKNVQGHYADAIIAFRSGQVLAATFLLRVVVEQHARASTGNTELTKADQVINQYQSSLPDNLKDYLPSFRSTYGELSVAMHEAKADLDLFKRSLEAVEQHFEVLRALKIMPGQAQD